MSMLEGFANAPRVPELRRRLLFSAVALAVYRLGVAIPTPGIDTAALKSYFDQAKGLLGMIGVFTGGALERFSIFSLGIMPYISASIILQLLTVVIPYLEKLSKEGELGRRKITQYTRYGTVLLSMVQSLFIARGLETIQAPGAGGVVFEPGWHFRIMTMITLTTGTAFIMWLGEQITERGIGNGISLLIFAGIVAGMPGAAGTVANLVRHGEWSIFRAVAMALLMVVVVAAIIYMERAQRRILTRITLPGALYVAAVCVLPTILISRYNVPFYFGGTALLIVVGVALDTVAAMETHMITRSYEGFMKGGRIRGRR